MTQTISVPLLSIRLDLNLSKLASGWQTAQHCGQIPLLHICFTISSTLDGSFFIISRFSVGFRA
jgi:hypothetical protein